MCRHKADSYQDRSHREVQGLMRASGLPEEVCYTLLYPDREEHTVDIVKQYLRTSEQKAWLDAHDLSIEDLLNGRYGGDDEPGVEATYGAWNADKRFRPCSYILRYLCASPIAKATLSSPSMTQTSSTHCGCVLRWSSTENTEVRDRGIGIQLNILLRCA